MKKILLLIMLIISTIVLVACNNNNNADKFNNIVISKYFEAHEMTDNVIELYNTGDKDIDLKGLRLDIYPNGDFMAEYKIELEGVIKTNDYFVISRPDANETIKAQSDFETTQLIYNGNDMIALVYNEEILDALGHYLSSFDFGKDATLIRKPANMQQRSEYREGDFIIYQAEVYEYLKNENFPIKTDEQLLNGPEFNPDHLDLPFIEPDDITQTIGGGGALEVRLVSISDGDTASFQRLDNNQTIRVRYLYIDTPEVSGPHTTEQAWGVQASNFNKLYLLANLQGKTIYLQTIKGQSTVDTFGRFLALVWVDGELSNHVIARNGLSQVSPDFTEGGMNTAYMQVPYFAFLLAGEANAQAKNLGVHGGVDPCWDYGQNKPNVGSCTVYPNDRDWK